MQLRPGLVLGPGLAGQLDRLLQMRRVSAQLIAVVAATHLTWELQQPLLQVGWGGDGQILCGSQTGRR